MGASLVIVGSGIRSGCDLTFAAREEIRRAEKLLYLVPDPITATWLQELNPKAESLHGLYAHDKARASTYAQMADRIMSHLRSGRSVCVVSYGHPGVFAYPMHEAIRQARAAGFEATMIPGISAIDWLYADLGIDPGVGGCQIYDATAFLGKRREPDAEGSLILLQVGLIGESTLPKKCNSKNFGRLIKRLAQIYGDDHEVVVYEASRFRVAYPMIQRMPLRHAKRAALSLGTTLYVPPRVRSREMISGMDRRAPRRRR